MDPQVKAVQQALIKLGYDVGKAGADGIIGGNTRAAIAKFQIDRQLKVQYPGTIGPTTLSALGVTAEKPLQSDSLDLPPWVAEFYRKVGLHEVRDNKELREYLKSDGKTLGDPAKLPWCGDLIETIFARTLPYEGLPNNPYYALNWAKFGRAVDKTKPALGDVGVVKRTGGGHVFIILGHDKRYWFAGGGNQSNKISVVKIDKDRTEAVRRPITWNGEPQLLGFSTLDAAISINEA